MSTQGPYNAGTFAEVPGSGDAWTFTAGALPATCPLSTGDNTDLLKITNFGFSIPSAATINGVQVAVTGYSSSGTTYATDAQLIKGGSLSGSFGTATPNDLPATSGLQSWGSTSDLWGNTLLYGDVNASNFGVALEWEDDTNNTTVHITAVTMTITYTGGAGAPVVQRRTFNFRPGSRQPI